ncbi:hypothetical protein GCM10009099_24930 [Caenispirillum bisanense]
MAVIFTDLVSAAWAFSDSIDRPTTAAAAAATRNGFSSTLLTSCWGVAESGTMRGKAASVKAATAATGSGTSGLRHASRSGGASRRSV